MKTKPTKAALAPEIETPAPDPITARATAAFEGVLATRSQHEQAAREKRGAMYAERFQPLLDFWCDELQRLREYEKKAAPIRAQAEALNVHPALIEEANAGLRIQSITDAMATARRLIDGTITHEPEWAAAEARQILRYSPKPFPSPTEALEEKLARLVSAMEDRDRAFQRVDPLTPVATVRPPDPRHGPASPGKAIMDFNPLERSW